MEYLSPVLFLLFGFVLFCSADRSLSLELCPFAGGPEILHPRALLRSKIRDGGEEWLSSVECVCVHLEKDVCSADFREEQCSRAICYAFTNLEEGTDRVKRGKCPHTPTTGVVGNVSLSMENHLLIE